MGTIPGPIVSFKFNAPSVSQAVAQVAKQAKSQFGKAGEESAKAFVDPLLAKAAKLRAQISADLKPDSQVLNIRNRLISSLQTEIELRTRKLKYTQEDLSLLKRYTLELERQKSFVAGTGGLTSGTSRFIGEAVNAIKLRLGSLGGFGGLGGVAAVRAYEPIGKFAEEGFSKFEQVVGPAAIAIGGVAAAITAVGVAASLTTKHMMDLAQSIQNTAAATGLNRTQVQVYGELAKEMNIDQGSIEMAFARMQSQLGEYAGTGSTSGSGSQYFVKILSQLGVQVKTTAGDMRPLNDIVSDFAKKLSDIPVPATRGDLALAALGTRGRIVAQMFEQAAAQGKTFKQVIDEISQSSMIMSDNEVTQLTKAKASWDEFTRGISGAARQLGAFVSLATIHPAEMAGAMITGGAPGVVQYMNAPVTQINPALAGIPISGISAELQRQALAGANASAVAQIQAREKLQAETIHAGGSLKFNLLQTEKDYSEAIKNNEFETAKHLAVQIQYLEKLVELDKKRNPDFNRLTRGAMGQNYTLVNPRLALQSPYERAHRLSPQLYGPNSGLGMTPFAAPQIPGFGNPNLPEGNAFALLGIPDPALTAQGIQAMSKLHDEWLNITSDAVAKIQIQYQKELENFQTLEIEKKISAQQFSQAQIELEAIAAAKIDEIHKQQLDKYKNEAGQLFDALVGGSKNFGQMFVRILEGAVMAPVKEVFEKVIAQMLQDLDKAISGKGGKGGKGIGGVLGKILGALGIGQNATLAVAQQNVQAQTVIITGNVAGMPNMSGTMGNSMFGGGMGFGGGGIGSVGSILGSVLPGAILLGQGLHDSNPVAIAMGIGMTGGPALTSLSKVLSKSHPELSGVLGKIGGALPGIGMIAAGTQMGGVGGFFTGMGGGALAGMELGGPIGAAIGAVVGGITSLFGGGSAARHAANWQKAVTRAMRGEQLILPPSETFAFSAMGSMAQTLGTTFSEGPGGTFGNVALPANTPFWANAILGYPKTGGQLTALQNALAGINTGLPFFGGSGTPFTGLPLPPGTRSFNSNATTVIHIQVDGKTMATALVKHMPNSAAKINTGMRQAAFSSTVLP